MMTDDENAGRRCTSTVVPFTILGERIPVQLYDSPDSSNTSKEYSSTPVDFDPGTWNSKVNPTGTLN
jgi:hypothetical protein